VALQPQTGRLLRGRQPAQGALGEIASPGGEERKHQEREVAR